MAIGYTSAARSSYFTQLLKLWVRSNRPDIFDAITAEANKKFPQLKKGARNTVSLPASLKDLK